MTTPAPAPKEVAEKLRGIGISESYASELARGVRSPSRRLALRIWSEAGIKLGPIANAQDSDIRALARIEGVAAA